MILFKKLFLCVQPQTQASCASKSTRPHRVTSKKWDCFGCTSVAVFALVSASSCPSITGLDRMRYTTQSPNHPLCLYLHVSTHQSADCDLIAKLQELGLQTCMIPALDHLSMIFFYHPFVPLPAGFVCLVLNVTVKTCHLPSLTLFGSQVSLTLRAISLSPVTCLLAPGILCSLNI